MTCSISATTLGWMPSVGSSRINSRGLVEQRPGDGELLALTARQQAGRPAQQAGRARGTCRAPRRSRTFDVETSWRFSIVVICGKQSWPCGT